MRSRPQPQRYSPRVHKMPRVIPGQPIRASKPPRDWRGLAFAILIVGVIMFVYWYIFMSEAFRITTVEVNGSENPAVKALAQELVGKNIFKVNSTSVEQSVRQVESTIGRVDLVRGLPHTVRLTISLREPVLRWQVKDKVFVLDSTGEIFTQGDAPQYATLPKIIDKSNVTYSVGQKIINQAFLVFVKQMYASSPTIMGKQVVTTEIAETTFHIDAILEGDIRVRLTTQRPLKEQFEGAKKILETHPEAKHVDVRVPRWGYWK